MENKMQQRVLLSGNTLTSIVGSNIYTLTNATVEDYHNVLQAQDEDQIKMLFNPELAVRERQYKEEVTRVENIRKGWKMLQDTGEFEIKVDSVYMVGINRSIPQLLINKFAEVLVRVTGDYYDQFKDVDHVTLHADTEYNGLKRFWKKCCLCPNAQSAEDLYIFLAHHNMKITNNGNFLAYRRVESKAGENKALVEFVSNQYTKIKARKKGPANYSVYKENEEYALYLNDEELAVGDLEYIGNLKELYLNIPDLSEVGYTDNRTKKFDYRINSIASMPRNEGNDDNTVSCSKGLHAASKEYDYTSFGDTDILVIINPIHVLAVNGCRFQ